MSNTACQISGIVKSFGPNKVLKEINLDLPAGMITVLMGANGAGKSTLVKILCGCLLYTSPSPRDGLLSRMPSSA